MPEPERDEALPTSGTVISSQGPVRRDEHMEEEEKVLAGRVDANIPALLTKDVLGG